MPVALRARWSGGGGPSGLRFHPWRQLLAGLEKIAALTGRAPSTAAHLEVGRRGEDFAYWSLRERGYTIVARNYRLPGMPGELDMIAWEGPTLVFIEVKTRTHASEIPAELAVDADKRAHLARLARAYRARRGQGPGAPRHRFDVVVIYAPHAARPHLTVHRDVLFE